MSQTDQFESVLGCLVQELDLPEEALNEASKRYEDLGAWFSREQSSCAQFSPHFFPQGSIALGTITRQDGQLAGYDLDAGCQLTALSANHISQRYLKELVGAELEFYRRARGIQAELEQKNRCWCLQYQGQPRFHMDVVPCVPAGSAVNLSLAKSMASSNLVFSEDAAHIASTAVKITDKRLENYGLISSDWLVSNPLGFIEWFRSRMIQERSLLMKAQVDGIPVYRHKTILQRIVQILKRHRDNLFGDSKAKPISIIITTLAARAYDGDQQLALALPGVVSRMAGLITSTWPRIPNPINPEEDFADRWATQDGRKLNLEANFHYWLSQLQQDLLQLERSGTTLIVADQFRKSFGVEVAESTLGTRLMMVSHVPAIILPRPHAITEPARPWAT